MNKLELFYPVKPNSINQGFGVVSPVYTSLGMKGHNGIDFYAVNAEPVRAAHSGIITFTGEDGSGGWGVVIRTTEQKTYENGTKSAFLKSIYWHLIPNSFTVHPGDTVQVGQIIALADNTGLSTGTHLHFGIKPVAQGENDWEWSNVDQNNGYLGAIDPLPYFGNLYAEDYYGIQQQINAIAKKIQELWNVIFHK